MQEEHRDNKTQESSQGYRPFATVDRVVTPFEAKHDSFQRLNGVHDDLPSRVPNPPAEHIQSLMASGWKPRHPDNSGLHPDFTKTSPTTGVSHYLHWNRDGSKTWLYDATVPDEHGLRAINETDPRRADGGRGSIPLADPDSANKTAREFDQAFVFGGPHENGIIHHFGPEAEKELMWTRSPTAYERSRHDEGGDPLAGTHRDPDVKYEDFDPFTYEHDEFREDPHGGGLGKLNKVATEAPFGDAHDLAGMGWTQIDPDNASAFEKQSNGFLHEVNYEEHPDSPTGYAWRLNTLAGGELVGSEGKGDYGDSYHLTPAEADAHTSVRERQYLQKGMDEGKFIAPGSQPRPTIFPLEADIYNAWGEESTRNRLKRAEPLSVKPTHYLHPMQRLNAKKSPVYKCFIYLIQSEKDIDLGQREITNPDDPDGDMSEQSAWWDIDHAKKNPALRDEVKKGTPWSELELWADKSVRSNREVVAMVQKLAERDPYLPITFSDESQPAMQSFMKHPDEGLVRTRDPNHMERINPNMDPLFELKNPLESGDTPMRVSGDRSCENCWFESGHAFAQSQKHFDLTGHKPMEPPKHVAAYSDERPPLPDSLRYYDTSEQPYQHFKDDGEETKFWRWRDTDLHPPQDINHTPGYQMGQNESHGRSVDWQPMVIEKPQTDYDDEEHFDRALAGPKTNVEWNNPICETCYLRYGGTVPIGGHTYAMGRYSDDLGEEKHEFKPMHPDVDQRGSLKESSAKTAAPLTNDVPSINRVIRSGDPRDPKENWGEGARVHDVSLPSGDWISKSPQYRHLNSAEYQSPSDAMYFLDAAAEGADMEEFASRLGHALSDPNALPIAPEAIRGSKPSDSTPTVYVKKYHDFRDMESIPPEEAHAHIDTPRGKVIGYFHSVLGEGDHFDHHNMGLVSGEPMSIDHSKSSLPEYANALAHADQEPDHVRFMTWQHEFGMSPYEAHFLDTDGAGWPVRKHNNPLHPQDTGRSLAASETLRPWAKERGREDWLDAAQRRMKMLGQRAGGAGSLFPYKMHHELDPVQHTASADRPALRSYRTIRRMIDQGRPEFVLRMADQMPVEHHDAIVNSQRPVYHEDPDQSQSKLYAARSNTHSTFLTPVSHKRTGEDGWLRGSTRTKPWEWKFYREHDLDNAITGKLPVEDRPRTADERYTRQWAKGTPEPEPQLEEGDRDLDEHGHQTVEPKRDTWNDLGALRGYADEPDYHREEKPWSDLNWTDQFGEPDFVKDLYRSDKNLPRRGSVSTEWWTAPVS